MNNEFPSPDYKKTDGLDLDVLALEVFKEFSDDFDKKLQPEILKRFDAFVELLKQVPSIETSTKLEMVLRRQLQQIATNVEIEDRQTVLVDAIVQKFEKTITPEACVQFNQYINTKIRPEIKNGNVIENLEAILMNKIEKADGMWKNEKKLFLKQITKIENVFKYLNNEILVSKLDSTEKNQFALAILQKSFKELRKRDESKLLGSFFARKNGGERSNSLDLGFFHRKIGELRGQVVEYFDAKFIDHFRSSKNDFDTALTSWKKDKQDLVQVLYIHFASMVFLHISEQLKTKKIASSGRSKKT